MKAVVRRGWEVKKAILELSYQKSTPHVSSALSVSDILVALFALKEKAGRNEIYLSKGHAALALYATLKEFGVISDQDLSLYADNDSIYEGHVNSKIKGVPLSTGSLGHALAFASGRALSDKTLGKRVNHWVVLSDGEMNEGSNWEAILLIAGLRLPNIHIVIDRNGLQSLKSTEQTVPLEPLGYKLEAFNWHVEDLDGHDILALMEGMNAANERNQPTCIIAHTRKGYPITEMMEDGVKFHYKPADDDHIRSFKSLSTYQVRNETISD